MRENTVLKSTNSIVLMSCLAFFFLAFGMFSLTMGVLEEKEKTNKQEVVKTVDKHYPALVKSLSDDKLSDDVIDAMLEIDSKTGKEYFTPIVLEVTGEDFSEKYKKQVKIKLKEVKKDWGTQE